MVIPFPTTKIQVLRTADAMSTDALDARTDESYVAVGHPIRARLSAPGGSRLNLQSGDISEVTLGLVCDPADISSGDRIRDLTTGGEYEVLWAHLQLGPLKHVKGFVQQVVHNA